MSHRTQARRPQCRVIHRSPSAVHFFSHLFASSVRLHYDKNVDFARFLNMECCKSVTLADLEKNYAAKFDFARYRSCPCSRKRWTDHHHTIVETMMNFTIAASERRSFVLFVLQAKPSDAISSRGVKLQPLACSVCGYLKDRASNILYSSV